LAPAVQTWHDGAFAARHSLGDSSAPESCYIAVVNSQPELHWPCHQGVGELGVEQRIQGIKFGR
jgi:hypothetical protein